MVGKKVIMERELLDYIWTGSTAVAVTLHCVWRSVY